MNSRTDVLYLIPARGGSKGIPGKNIKLLVGKPLLCYTIDVARDLTSVDNICVSTDDAAIKEVAEKYGVPVRFLRPKELATDSAGSFGVVRHALRSFPTSSQRFTAVALLQPTSPFRTAKQIEDALGLYSNVLDMIVSVRKSRSNPYYTLFEEDADGFLTRSKSAGPISRRQDAPVVYELNGSIYIINPDSINRFESFDQFPRVRKYVMDDLHSVDIDSPFDWSFAEFLLREGIIHHI